MDVHCSTCREPWDVYHLRHEAIHETGLSVEEAREWGSLPHSQRLSNRYREAFRCGGWEFGQSVINVVRCPCCPKDAKPDAEKLMARKAIEAFFGDDEDGLASTLEEHDSQET